MKAGLFIAKNNITEKLFIVSVNGIEPFLRISNIISTTAFVNGELILDTEEKGNILENPNNYEFKELSKEIERSKEVPVKETIPTIDDTTYNKLKKYQREGGFLDRIEIISQIISIYKVNLSVASKMFEIIEKRYDYELKDEYEQTSNI